MNNKRIIIGVTIGITAAILWSVVFINVLNSMAGIGIGVCLGISLVYLAVLFFQKKIKINDDTTSGLLYSPIMRAGKYTCYFSNNQRKESIEGLRHGAQDGSPHHAKTEPVFQIWKRVRFFHLNLYH
ncbi:MAG: hypothetical protein ACLTV6_01660 [Christensenellales bacterium]